MFVTAPPATDMTAIELVENMPLEMKFVPTQQVMCNLILRALTIKNVEEELIPREVYVFPSPE